jgi:hypothetical protein
MAYVLSLLLLLNVQLGNRKMSEKENSETARLEAKFASMTDFPTATTSEAPKVVISKAKAAALAKEEKKAKKAKTATPDKAAAKVQEAAAPVAAKAKQAAKPVEDSAATRRKAMAVSNCQLLYSLYGLCCKVRCDDGADSSNVKHQLLSSSLLVALYTLECHTATHSLIY